MNLKDKRLLVTGASSGIGQAIAIECAKNGATVAINYRKNKSGAEETLKAIEQYSKGEIAQADLTHKDAVAKMFMDIGKLDCLVNNAGEYMGGDFDDYDVWEEQLKNILMTQVYCANEFIKHNKNKDLKKIVNVGSVYGIPATSDPDSPAYSAAKAAVTSFTTNLAKKFAPNILVNAVAPGYVWTAPWEETTDLKRYTEVTKIKRFIEPEEIATMVVEILKNDAITGEIVRIDGGLHLVDLELKSR